MTRTALTPSESTRQWAKEALAGSQEAYGQLYDALIGPVRSFLVGLRMGLSQAEVNDAIQDVFLRLFKQLDRLQKADAPVPYVLGISRHVALDRLRKRARRELAASEVLSTVASTENVVETASSNERSLMIRETLDALKPAQRGVLTLRHLNGLTMEQLAAALDCSVPTARTRLRSASRALAGALRQRGLLPRETP